MDQSQDQNTIQTYQIPADTLPGLVHLKIADLERELEFYQKVIGLQLHWVDGTGAGLGAGAEELVRLTQIENAQRYRGTTGIYHFAILLPDQRELARVIARLYTLKWPNYPTDHVMTKTTYLDDPEGNNIELYAESPEDGSWTMKDGVYITRRVDGSLSSGRDALDLEKLFAHLRPEDKIEQRMPEATRMGHFHLYVSNLQESIRFYHEVLGFDVMGHDERIRMGMVSAGGYHHHIGLNTWLGEGAPPAPENALGLKYISFNLPDRQSLEDLLNHVKETGEEVLETEAGFEVRDPSQNRVVFSA